MSSMQPVLAPKAKQHYAPIIIGIVLLLAAIGIGYLALTTPTMQSSVARAPLAVNPELKYASLYEGAASVPTLAENPELISLQRYVTLHTVSVERNVLAVNPELTAVQRYAAAAAADAPARDVLAVNPELKSYLRYTNR